MARNISRLSFQFLIGRLVTNLHAEPETMGDRFQFLIGRLVTREALEDWGLDMEVSIPHR